MRALLRGLPAGYNRDVQETKEALIRGIDLGLDMLAIARQAIGSLEVNEDRLRDALTPEIFATDEALRLVAEGKSFRDAYRTVGGSIDQIPRDTIDVDALIARRSATGTPGNPDIATVVGWTESLRREVESDRNAVATAVAALAGGPVSLYARFAGQG